MQNLAFFKKELPQTPVRLNNGRRVQFDPISTSFGYLKVDLDTNGDMAAQIRTFSAGGKYGVMEITAEQYDLEFVQKKSSSRSLLPPWLGGTAKSDRDRLSSARAPDTTTAQVPQQGDPVSLAGGNQSAPEPPVVPRRPRTARISAQPA